MEDSAKLNNLPTSNDSEREETSSVHIEIESGKVIPNDVLTKLTCIENISTRNNALGTFQTYRCDAEPRGPYYQEQRVGQMPAYLSRDRPSQNSSNNMFNELFNDTAIRNKFIQKVYMILTIQLLYTFFFTGLCLFEPHVREFVSINVFVLLLAMVANFVLMCALMCCEDVRRAYPANFVVLSIFTITMAYIVGFISVYTKTEIVLLSVGITAGVCLFLSLFACQTSVDFTLCGMCLCMLVLMVLIFGTVVTIVTMFVGRSKLLIVVYSGVVALLFSVYLIYDTQMIIGGRRVELSPEEYIFGAFTLYLDIIELLLHIMRILKELS